MRRKGSGGRIEATKRYATVANRSKREVGKNNIANVGSGRVLESLALGAHVLKRARRIEDDLVQVLDLGMPKRAGRVTPLAVLGTTHRLCERESARVMRVQSVQRGQPFNMHGLDEHVSGHENTRV